MACVESGRLSQPRPTWDRVIEVAHDNRWAIVAVDWTRLLRSERFDGIRNPWVKPTRDEWARFWHKLSGVPFVGTLASPTAPPQRLHREATRRAQAGKSKGGRPPMDERTREMVYHALHNREYGGARTTLPAIASQFGVSLGYVKKVSAWMAELYSGKGCGGGGRKRL